jgi:hypothetical protein
MKENTDTTARLHGECRCGAVKFSVVGQPKRIGICHCTDCRQESGSAFTYYAVWPIDGFKTSGHTAVHLGRRFCPACGSSVFADEPNEVEVKLGALKQAPTNLRPTYELWIKRREPWLRPIEGAEQYQEDRI